MTESTQDVSAKTGPILGIGLTKPKFDKGIVISYNKMTKKNIVLEDVIFVPENKQDTIRKFKETYDELGLTEYVVTKDELTAALKDQGGEGGGGKVGGVQLSQKELQKAILPGSYFYISFENFTASLVDQMLINKFKELAVGPDGKLDAEKQKIINTILNSANTNTANNTIGSLLQVNVKAENPTEENMRKAIQNVIKDIFTLDGGVGTNKPTQSKNYASGNIDTVKRRLQGSLINIQKAFQEKEDDQFDFIDLLISLNITNLTNFFVDIYNEEGGEPPPKDKKKQDDDKQENYLRKAIEMSLKKGGIVLRKFFMGSVIYKYMENWSHFVDFASNKEDLLNFIFTKGTSPFVIKEVNLAPSFADLFNKSISKDLRSQRDKNNHITAVEIYLNSSLDLTKIHNNRIKNHFKYL